MTEYITTTTSSTTSPSASALPAVKLHEYYLVRWHVCLRELRWLADQLGFQDRLPKREEWRGQGD